MESRLVRIPAFGVNCSEHALSQTMLEGLFSYTYLICNSGSSEHHYLPLPSLELLVVAFWSSRLSPYLCRCLESGLKASFILPTYAVVLLHGYYNPTHEPPSDTTRHWSALSATVSGRPPEAAVL